MQTTTEQTPKLPAHLAPIYAALAGRRSGIGLAREWLEATSPEQAGEAWRALDSWLGRRDDSGRWVQPIQPRDLIELARRVGWTCRRTA